MRVLHWISVALMIVVYSLAFSIETASSPEQARSILMLHRSVGAIIMIVTLCRLLVRFGSPVPHLPQDLPWWQVIAARANILGLYLLLLLQPTLGLSASWLHGDHVAFFGLTVPSPLWIDRPLSRTLFALHTDVGFALLALIAMHIGAALFHHFVRRDDVLLSMTTGTSSIKAATPVTKAP